VNHIGPSAHPLPPTPQSGIHPCHFDRSALTLLSTFAPAKVSAHAAEKSLFDARMSLQPRNSIVTHRQLNCRDFSPPSAFNRPILIIFQSLAVFAYCWQNSSAYLSTTYSLFFARFYHFSHVPSFVFNTLWTLF
jgi:hypothetical protein